MSTKNPKDKTSTRPGEPGSLTELGKEPIFTVDPNDVTNTKAIHGRPSEPLMEEQLGRLKSEVDNISSQAGNRGLTNDETEILKRYIALKESEVADLKDQHRQYQAYLKRLASDVDALGNRNRDLIVELESVRKREESARNELRDYRAKQTEDMAILKNDYEEKLRKSGNYESQVGELIQKREEWKEKVKDDLKRIKLKERELENKHELLKRDMQALLDSKDKHTLELKTKNDALELELETLEERVRKANGILNSIDSKKRRLIETLKLASSLLDSIDSVDESSLPEPKRSAGGR